MNILQKLYLTNSLSNACLGQEIIKIMQLKILLRVQWIRLVVRGLKHSQWQNFHLFVQQCVNLYRTPVCEHTRRLEVSTVHINARGHAAAI
jgi:hypothetical protein